MRPYPRPQKSAKYNPIEADGWEITINGDLTDKQMDLASALVEVPRNSRGTIFIDSGGGSAYVGLALASLIRLRGLKATAVVSGECSSAAIMPFAACERRYVTKHSTLLFHPIRWQSEEDVRIEEAAEWARHFKALEADLDDLLVKLLPLSREKLAQWTRPGKFITGEQIAAAGIAKLVDLFSGDVWTQIRKLDSD
jgi:ATP-dependent protease ClpP protease subunit